MSELLSSSSFTVALVVALVTALYYHHKKSETRRREEAAHARAAARRQIQEQEDAHQARLRQQEERDAAKKQKKKKKNKPGDAAHDPSRHPNYVRRFGGHTGTVTGMSLSPNGEWLATCGSDGQLRVARAEKHSDNASMFVAAHGPEPLDHVCWEADNRTLACATRRTQAVTFYRVRGKKAAAAAPHAFPYELVELVKRRFETRDRLSAISSLVTDRSSVAYHLVLTGGEVATSSQGGNKTIVAWDGSGVQKHFLASLPTGCPGDARLSQDGKFLCGRAAGAGKEVKVFEVVKKRHKGEAEPQFERVAKAMSLYVGKDVADVDFLYDGGGTCDRALVACADGTFQVWNLAVEYRRGEDPRLVRSGAPLPEAPGGGAEDVAAIATSHRNGRVAVATADATVHAFTCADDGALVHDGALDNCHGHRGIAGDLQFNQEGTAVYTRGTLSRDVFSWKI